MVVVVVTPIRPPTCGPTPHLQLSKGASLASHVSMRLAACSGFVHRSVTVRVVGTLGQLKRCRVSCVCSVHSGQVSVVYVIGLMLCKYCLSSVDLFDLCWASSVLVCIFSCSSDLWIIGGNVLSSLLGFLECRYSCVIRVWVSLLIVLMFCVEYYNGS